MALPATTTVEDLVKALNMIGVGPRDLVAVLQAMKAAGRHRRRPGGDVMKPIQ